MALKINGVGIQPEDTRICVVMVGLPARGKSYIAQRGEAPSLDNNTSSNPRTMLTGLFLCSTALSKVAFDPSGDLQRRQLPPPRCTSSFGRLLRYK